MAGKDKYGVFSDELTYKGFNIDLTVSEGATVYYSTTTELTDENYETEGLTTLANLPAGADVHTVYYYVTDGISAVRGSKRVIIEKARQTAPENLIARAESYLNSGDGIISGLTPRKMEYRNAGNDGTYTTAYSEKIYVAPGTYLVRKKADENHYASPDTVVVVPQSPPITVEFDSNGGSAVPSLTDLACGNLVPRPEDPTLPGATFLGWYRYGALYSFDAPVIMNMTLFAAWTPAEPVSLALPASLKAIGESAFEGMTAVTSVVIPEGCASIGANAFKDCANLRHIVIPLSVTEIDATAFDGCMWVFVFGTPGSEAEQYCDYFENCVFIPEEQD